MCVPESLQQSPAKQVLQVPQGTLAVLSVLAAGEGSSPSPAPSFLKLTDSERLFRANETPDYLAHRDEHRGRVLFRAHR